MCFLDIKLDMEAIQKLYLPVFFDETPLDIDHVRICT